MKIWTRTIAALAMLLTLALPAVPAQADAPSHTVPDEQVQRQVVHLLQSEATHTQERGVQLVFQFAQADAFDASFFRGLEAPLLDLVTGEGHESVRIMAVSALYRIGTPGAMQRLHDAAGAIENARVRRLCKRAAAQYRIDRAAEKEKRLVERVMWRNWT